MEVLTATFRAMNNTCDNQPTRFGTPFAQVMIWPVQFSWYLFREMPKTLLSSISRRLPSFLCIFLLVCVATTQQQSGEKVSSQLSSFLGLTASQRKSISLTNEGSASATEKHSQSVAMLKKEQRAKLRTLYAPDADTSLKAEALSLHLLCPPHPFGGAATKFSTSTCVDQSAAQDRAPANPPQ
jgi:hypothetical protein